MNVPERSSGVLLHITSLPGGTLGREAYRFIDWLAAAGQSWWQVLPISPPDRHRSPYKSASAFAGWRGLLSAPRARVSAAEVLEFRDRETYWIEDWARLGPGSRSELVADQVRFEREWARLREYAAERGVRVMGDVAIYVAPNSVDHRAHPKLFNDEVLAGAPPDAFSERQFWGNPVYDWAALRESDYRWWVERLQRNLTLFDAVRLDHFRGFIAYWAVPAGAADARAGRWRRGPGMRLFEAFQQQLGAGLPLVAEDLGVITPAVEDLRHALGVPGMLVLQFGFGGVRADRTSPHAFANHALNRVVYTGTHDHDTARGWFESASVATRARVEQVCRSVGISEPEPWWQLVRLCLDSHSAVAIVQAQDLLGLGSEARMNNPSKRGGNWRWQLETGALTVGLAARLRDATAATGRLRPA